MTRTSPQNKSAHRKIRSERMEAIKAVIRVILRHLDPATGFIGVTAPDRSFIGLDIKTIAQKSGLGRRRCERAIANLKQMRLIEVYPPGQHSLASNRIKYSASRAARAVTPSFYEYLLLTGFCILEGWPDASTAVINEDMA